MVSSFHQGNDLAFCAGQFHPDTLLFTVINFCELFVAFLENVLAIEQFRICPRDLIPDSSKLALLFFPFQNLLWRFAGLFVCVPIIVVNRQRVFLNDILMPFEIDCGTSNSINKIGWQR